MDMAESSSSYLVGMLRVSSGILHFEHSVRYRHAVVGISSLGLRSSPDQPPDAAESHGISHSALSAAEAIMTKLGSDSGQTVRTPTACMYCQNATTEGLIG